MSRLAQIDAPRGLPRGRGSLAPQAVADAQRGRLLRATIAVVAERGYANVRIADIVELARVSRQSFYLQFADKEQCFLAAHDLGMQLILSRLGAWASEPPDPDPRAQLSGGIAAYLGLAHDEPEFARCMLVELQAIGPAGLTARVRAHEQMAALIRLWHGQAREQHPEWPAVPPSRYAAAVGAVHDLLFTLVAGRHLGLSTAAGREADPRALLRAAVDTVATLLRIPPPPSPDLVDGSVARLADEQRDHP